MDIEQAIHMINCDQTSENYRELEQHLETLKAKVRRYMEINNILSSGYNLSVDEYTELCYLDCELREICTGGNLR
jgi:predicted translin family RNA/ssDNA-binding protein